MNKARLRKENQKFKDLSLRNQWRQHFEKGAESWLNFDGNKFDAGNNEEGC